MEPSYSPPAPAPAPSYAPPAPSPSHSPPAEDPTVLAPTYNADPVEDENGDPESYNNKRQATGFWKQDFGKPPVFPHGGGTPDIWSMFSDEWGQRLSRRMGTGAQWGGGGVMLVIVIGHCHTQDGALTLTQYIKVQILVIVKNPSQHVRSHFED